MRRLFFLLEEQSAAPVIRALAKQALGDEAEINIRISSGKQGLLTTLENRLRGFLYDPDCYVFVMVDRDTDDCVVLKQRLEDCAQRVGIPTRTRPAHDGQYRVVTRIVIEELEAWYFGDHAALRAAFPDLPQKLEKTATYRTPDTLEDPWEKLEALLRSTRRFGNQNILSKVSVAEEIAPHLDITRNDSTSFRAFVTALQELPRP
jgi:hypothetical protein